MPTISPSFTLWHRSPRHHWQVIGSAPTKQDLLVRIAEELPRGAVTMILPAAAHPDDARRPRSLAELRKHPAITTGAALLERQSPG